MVGSQMNGGTGNSASPPLIPECLLLNADPSELCVPPAERPENAKYKGARVIKTVKFTEVLFQEWKDECYPDGVDQKLSSVGKPHVYTNETGKNYYGHVVYPPDFNEGEILPGIIIFQTGAGPRDLYFHWKADAFARGIHNGVQTKYRCIVFIADSFSDERGWGWDNDKAFYNSVRKDILEPNSEGIREKLRKQTLLCINTFKNEIQGVDKNNIAAFGWCFGGQTILELSRMRLSGIKCAAAFHGVFDGIARTKLEDTSGPPLSMAICHASADPFFELEDLVFLKNQLNKANGVEWIMHEFGGPIYHGFTNPSHRYHPRPKYFNYSESATKFSMRAALELFADTCFPSHRYHPRPKYFNYSESATKFSMRAALELFADTCFPN